MKKYQSVLRRVEEVEYKLGISYAKTSGKLYNSMWIANLLGVIYMFFINALVILSAVMNAAVGNDRILSNQSLILLGISTVLEILGVIFTKTRFEIIGSVLGILPLPYMVYVFIKLCYGYGQGLFNVKAIFYIRHFPSLALISVSCLVMLFISARQRIRTNSDYKRILTNIYDNYVNEKKRENIEISDEEWHNFIENYNPKDM